jgi:hypothetical protein
MPMPPYPLRCYRPGCEQPAVYKIAARWSDGATEELKTYALTCAACLAEWYRCSCVKQAACRLAPGETLDRPGIFELVRGNRDRQLRRRNDLEDQVAAATDERRMETCGSDPAGEGPHNSQGSV